jgi:hypothetical protein
MGQYFNQPDFATSAETVVVGTTNVKNSALYIGSGGNIEVIVVGDSAPVVFKNIPDGSFLPVIISSIVAGANTTVSDLVAIK